MFQNRQSIDIINYLRRKEDLSRLGLVQYFVFSCLQVMFTSTFNCYDTIANILVGRNFFNLNKD